MAVDKEPSVLDYARFYGLASDHRAIDLTRIITDLTLSAPPQDLSQLCEIDTTDSTLPPEKLQVPKEAVALITSIRRAEFEKPPLDPCFLPDSRRTRNLKMEIPLLRTDHEIDMLDWGTKLKMPDLANEHFPLEALNDELDEGMGWPSGVGEMLEKCVSRSTSEKISMSKEDFLYFQGVLGLQTGHGSRGEDFKVDYKPKEEKQYLTPIMLPMSPTSLPFIPSSEVGHFELVSDHSNLFWNELAELDEQIFGTGNQETIKKREASPYSLEQDNVDEVSIGDIYSPLKPVKPDLSPPPHKRRRRAVSEVRGPLTPLPSEFVTRGDAEWRSSKGPFDISACLPPLVDKPENLSSDDIDRLFADTLQPMAQEAMKVLENEQLMEADVTGRVKVPTLDFSRPLLPWQEHQEGLKAATNYPKPLDSAPLEDVHGYLWPTSIKTERALNWVPFPASIARIAPETFPEGLSVEDLVGNISCLDHRTPVWKPDGLRILDESDSDDEDLFKADFPNTAELDGLVRKKQLEKQTNEGLNDQKIFDLVNRKAEPAPVPPKHARKKEEYPEETTFSPFSAIGNFMDVRKGKITRYKNTFHKEPDSISLPNPPGPSTKLDLKQHDSQLEQIPPVLDLHVPAIKRYFVVSSSLVSNIRLSNQIRQLYPYAELVERDFALYVKRPQTMSQAHGFDKMTANDSIADEADILLSPRCGLILTTLSQVKQRSLPGQVARSSIKERIQRTALRYEALFVLISEGRVGKRSTDYRSIHESDIGSADSKSISEFTAFCSTLNAEVSVIYIDGGEEELVRWTVSMMVKYGTSYPGIKLLQNETNWEVFLRRAGMNAFAAQVVLAELKAPAGSRDGLHPNDQYFGDYGLSGFVKMSPYERTNRFEHIFRGTSLLQRVSRNIDGGWTR